MRVCLPIFILVFALPASSGELGQPLDCSDFVFLKEGLTCRTLIPSDTDAGQFGYPSLFAFPWHNTPLDNQGMMYRVTDDFDYFGKVCQDQFGTPVALGQVQLWAWDAINPPEVVAHVDERCEEVPDGLTDRVIGLGPAHFDAVRGRLLIWLEVCCDGLGCNYRRCIPFGGGEPWLASIEGFPTLAETLGLASGGDDENADDEDDDD